MNLSGARVPKNLNLKDRVVHLDLNDIPPSFDWRD
jgi:hypothetical protein